MAKIIAGDIPSHTQSVLFEVASRGTNADTDSNLMFRAPNDMKVKKAYVTFKSALTGADTNYCTVRLRNLGTNGSGTTDIATLAFTSGVTASAKVPKALTLASDVTVDEGEVLVARIDHEGSGLKSDIAILQVDYTWE
mgnify:CR=1 FL=1